MSRPFHNADRKTNIHAPWRIEYIEMLGDEGQGCFLCRARQQTGRDEENLLLWRTEHSLVVLNRFPYTSGHLLVAPTGHVGALSDLNGEQMREMMELTRDATQLLRHVIKAEGFNIGINLGRCAGAGLPDHVHLHVVPRWSGDTNFISVLGDIRIIPQFLTDLRGKLLAAGEELKLPSVVYDR